MTGIILRKLNPQLTDTELFYAIVKEFCTYFENKDKKYNLLRLMEITDAILDADIETELSNWKRKNYKVNTQYCEKHHKTKRQICGATNAKKRKSINYERIAQYYDPTLTDNANLLKMNRKGVKITRQTLYNFRVEYGYIETDTNTPTQTATEGTEDTTLPKSDQTKHQKADKMLYISNMDVKNRNIIRREY